MCLLFLLLMLYCSDFINNPVITVPVYNVELNII